jgi:hypothetical protein
MTGYNSTVTKTKKIKTLFSARLFVFDVVAIWRDAAFFLSFPFLCFAFILRFPLFAPALPSNTAT